MGVKKNPKSTRFLASPQLGVGTTVIAGMITLPHHFVKANKAEE